MNKILVILLVVTAGAAYSQVSQFQGILQDANQYYADGQFDEAVKAYESIIAGNYESAAVYFNLGNAYFKNGDIPSAILNYEKALKLDPTDRDIRFNLDLANSRVIDKIEPLPEFFLKSWWRSARNLLPSDRWAVLGLVSLFLVLASASFFIISRSVRIRRISFWIGIVITAVMAFSFIFSTGGYRHYLRHDSGIIFTPTVTVKSSPNENSVDLFVIHEGTKVFILDRVEAWTEIKLANGNVGWVKTAVYKPV